jgi:serine/threonine-protein kinase
MLALLTAGTAGSAAMAAPRSAATPSDFVPVPDVSGDSIPAASAVLRAAGFMMGNATISDSCSVSLQNRVLSTSPAAGMQAVTGLPIDLVMCRSAIVTVPSVTGDTVHDAAEVLLTVGLTAETEAACSSPPGTVAFTDPRAGQTTNYGTGVLVTCNRPPTTAAVPNVIGETISNATTDIQAAGLTAGQLRLTTSCDVLPGTVASTSPFPGDVVPLGTAVNLTESTGRPKTPCP